MISTCWSLSVMSVLTALLHRQGQSDRNRHALVHARAGRFDGPVIGGHERTGDPEPQAEARGHLRVSISTEELLSKQNPVVGIKARTLVGDRNCELAGFVLPVDADGGLRRRIFGGIVENLRERPDPQ